MLHPEADTEKAGKQILAKAIAAGKQQQLEKGVTRLIVECGLPLTLVEASAFRDLLLQGTPQFKCFTADARFAVGGLFAT